VTSNMMSCIYELKRDADGITRMQQASLESPYGLKITHGLVGSAEWWQQVASGALPTRHRVGLVSGFWPGQGKAGPAEFQLRAEDGSTSNWPCEMEPLAAEREFKLHRPAAVEYVVQELKMPFDDRTETIIPMSIWLSAVQPDAEADAALPRGLIYP
jgi:hypothetical protein